MCTDPTTSNFGQHILLFDQVFGTLREEKREYSEDIFGGHGKSKGS